MNKLAINGGKAVRSEPWPERGRRFGEEEARQLREALDQNTLFYMHGEKTNRMRQAMSELCGAEFVVPCSSGSAALHGAVKACGVGPGDEVITSPITDAGTVLGVIYEGAIPIFADIDALTYNITAESIEERITERTRAVIVVHLAGSPAEIQPIVELCRERELRLIEDCAQSWGAKLNGRWVGTFGDAGCFSLNDYKHISAGDAGLIITDQEELHREAWRSIDKCYDRIEGKRDLPFVAPNYRITELQSAVAIAQLGKVEGLTAERNRLGTRLSEKLQGIPGIHPPRIPEGAYATYWFYLIQTDPHVLDVTPEGFADAMNAEGIPGNAGYVDPVYLSYKYLQNQSAFHHSRWPFSQLPDPPPYREGYCPNAETVLKRTFLFPLREELSDREIDDAARAVRKLAAHYS